MIVPMNKYTFVVLESQREQFIASLQELGLVDVTTTGWEPGEDDRALMHTIDKHREAVEFLTKLSKDEGFVAGEPYDTGTQAFERYSVAQREMAELDSEIVRYEKLADEMRPWGATSPAILGELAEMGVVLHYFTTDATSFAKKRDEWSEGRILEEVATTKGTTYFVVVVTEDNGDIQIDATEVKLSAESLPEIEAKIGEMKQKQAGWNKVYARAAATVDKIEAERECLSSQLQFTQAAVSGESAAEGSLVVMEAWARQKQENQVDSMLTEYPDVIFIKDRPTMDDETPVELKNNRAFSPFEFIGDLYAKPRYGRMDLTRWFAPFFMLFFGMCMGDLGYGTLIFIGGLVVTLMSKTESMKQIGRLTVWCGGAAMVMGFLMGALFGVSLGDMAIFTPIKHIFIPMNTMFFLSIGIGLFTVLFAMVLNIITTIRAFGIKAAFDTLGWFIVLVTCLAAYGLQYLGIEGFEPGSVLFWICLCVGGFMMLFLNDPGRNPLINLGSGLWGLFNHITGILGDALSYIRLFAIGLSGGVLAMVFNQIAFAIAPDIPVVGQLVTLIILLFGHTLNLFMSILSSIVHPLRLTFVEFFNNAGFEATDRVFTPLSKESKNQ
jgi:V/A-type H+-transporting ATPase subunit I